MKIVTAGYPVVGYGRKRNRSDDADYKTCTLSEEDSKNLIVADCVELLKKHGFSKEATASYVATLNMVLDLYREKLGEQEVIQYVVRKRFMRIDCTLSIAGEMISPLDAENYTSNRERVKEP